MNSGKTLLGVLVGLTAGAVLGILFAPEKGAITRKNISKKGEDLAGMLNDKIDAKFRDALNSITGKMGGTKSKKEDSTPLKAEIFE